MSKPLHTTQQYELSSKFNDLSGLVRKVEQGYSYCVVTNNGAMDFALWQARHDPRGQKSIFGELPDTALFRDLSAAKSFLHTAPDGGIDLVIQLHRNPPGSQAPLNAEPLPDTRILQRQAKKIALC